ncbi:MAG TPA: hypothetical protein VNT32_14455 [Thermoleophilaceae bacterium]|nr:hypothetical protein [Thermoleophilaceae bacterium]
MSERAATRATPPSVLSTLLARAEAFLLEPAQEASAPPSLQSCGPAVPPVVAVCGLRARTGATTVARALGVELARLDPGGAAAVSAESAPAGLPLGTAAAARLARAASTRGGLDARASGRLCLVGPAGPAEAERALAGLAPLVIDAGPVTQAAPAASLATAVVLVAGETDEPALAAVLAERLARVGPRPLVVLNGGGSVGERWGGRSDVALPRSRGCARLAAAGRPGTGPFTEAVARLASLCER